MARILNKEVALRALELAKHEYRPAQILELKEQIEAETRVAQLKANTTGTPDPEDVKKIVRMKIELDNLYADWAEGKIE